MYKYLLAIIILLLFSSMIISMTMPPINANNTNEIYNNKNNNIDVKTDIVSINLDDGRTLTMIKPDSFLKQNPDKEKNKNRLYYEYLPGDSGSTSNIMTYLVIIDWFGNNINESNSTNEDITNEMVDMDLKYINMHPFTQKYTATSNTKEMIGYYLKYNLEWVEIKLVLDKDNLTNNEKTKIKNEFERIISSVKLIDSKDDTKKTE